jgi:hypothetical protein
MFRDFQHRCEKPLENVLSVCGGQPTLSNISASTEDGTLCVRVSHFEEPHL